jgi:hypothetical protein
MRWRDFIFSNKRQTRLLRHFVFWTSWWIYFYGVRFFYPKAFLPGHSAVSRMRADNTNNTFRQYGDYVADTHVWSLAEFVRSLLMVSIHIAACYIVIYFLLPRILLKAKYFLSLVAAILMVAAMVLASRFMDTVVVPATIREGTEVTIPFYSSIFSGVINALIIIAAASTMKFGKYWWQKQKEKEQLEREKINTELQLLKAQIRPAFLFNSLNHIYAFSMTASPRAPELLLKLSGLLSYMLYECEKSFVPLEREISMMKDYMALEKIRLKETIEMEISVTGDLKGKMIAPFLLLPFIENSLKQCSDLTRDNWINMDISMEDSFFCMKLANGTVPDSEAQHQVLSNSLANVQKRLTLLYPQKHELKISHEPEMLIVLLKIRVTEISLENEKSQKIIDTDSVPEQSYIYAPQ